MYYCSAASALDLLTNQFLSENKRSSCFLIISTLTNLQTADCKMGLGTIMSVFGLIAVTESLLTKTLVGWLTSGPKAKKVEEWGMWVHISHSPKIVELFCIIFSEAGRGKWISHCLSRLNCLCYSQHLCPWNQVERISRANLKKCDDKKMDRVEGWSLPT